MFDFMNLAWVFGNRGYYISSYDIDDAMDSVMIMLGILIGVGIIAWGILGYRGQTIQTFSREGVRKRNF